MGLQEEKQARSARVKRRFRAIVRSVINNLYWLNDTDSTELGEDVQKNIQILTRSKKKDKLQLQLRDKAILRKTTECRTDADITHLDKVIGDFICFRKYPSKVRRQLVGVTFFVYVSEKRVIMRQDQPASGLYFLLSGEVSVTQTTFDEVTEQNVTREVAKRHGGTMFGEVSMLHKIPRTATITTLTHCELLFLPEDAFDAILKDTLQKQWDEITSAMAMFPYFAEWDSVAIRECCFLSVIMHVNENVTVLGDGEGNSTMAYFVIKGEVVIIEHLPVERTIKRGIATYKRYIPQSCKENENGSSNSQETQGATFDGPAGTSNLISGTSVEHDEFGEVKKSSRKRTKSVYHLQNLPSNVKIHFVQVAFLRKKAAFMSCPLTYNRRIVTTTKSSFLLMPIYWLSTHDKANVWKRLYSFMVMKIPTQEMIFNKMIRDLTWRKLKAKYVRNITRKSYPNTTTFNDVPYSIRITEPPKY